MCVKSFTNKLNILFTGACLVEASAYIWVYILIIVLPLTAFLLVCLLTQQGWVLTSSWVIIIDTVFIKHLNALTFFGLERVRKLIFPEVPDPKHFKNKIMDTEQSQVRPTPPIISNALIWQNKPKDVCSSYSWKRICTFKPYNSCFLKQVLFYSRNHTQLQIKCEFCHHPVL